MKVLFAVVLSHFLIITVSGKDIGKELKTSPDSVWNMSADNFKKALEGYGKCQWGNNLKTDIRYKFVPEKKNVYFFDQQILKASFRFLNKYQLQRAPSYARNQRLKGMYLTFKVNQGDIDKNTYLKNMESLKTKIEALGKLPRPRITKRKSWEWSRYSCLWRSPQYTICLRWEYSNTAAAFKSKAARLSIFYTPPKVEKPKEPLNKYGKMIDEESIDYADGKNENDVLLKVPMIAEKSRKNNLSVAVERIISYYNQLGNDSKNGYKVRKNGASGKTNYLDKLPVEYAAKRYILDERIGVKRLVDPDCFEDYKSFRNLLYQYYGDNVIYHYKRGWKNNVHYKTNKNCKKEVVVFRIESRNGGSKKLTKDIFIRLTKYGYICLGNHFEILQNMNDEKRLLKARCKSSRVNHFKARVRKQIMDGKPVLWDVIIGVLKEKVAMPYKKGEYVRLIVGYNDKTDELIYSDSLGKGHEMKKMSWDKAWAITYKALILNRKKTLR